METQERRRGRDRRSHWRGGRRPGDRPGHAPLVFVVTGEPLHLRFWERLLLDLKFAVLPCKGPGPALDAYRAVRPDLIAASSQHIITMRDCLPCGRQGSAVPLVELASTPDLVEPVITAIRRALRAGQVAPPPPSPSIE